MDKSKAQDTLARFCGALDAAGYGGRYWITCGTLLGLSRDGDFIGHDSDIDFGMFAADYDDGVPEALKAAGFALRKTAGSRQNGLILTFSDGGPKCDIFFCYRANGKIWHAVNSGRPQIRYYYDEFSLSGARFKGVDVSIPHPAEAVLEANYGPEWRRPVRRWHYAYSPYNVSVVGGPLQQAKYWAKNGIWQVKSRLRAAFRTMQAGLAGRR